MPNLTDEQLRPLTKALRQGDPAEARRELEELLRELDSQPRKPPKHAEDAPLEELEDCIGASG
jgi:hypothetical protein